MSLPIVTRAVRIESNTASAAEEGDGYALPQWTVLADQVPAHLSAPTATNLGDAWQNIEAVVYLPPNTPCDVGGRIIDLTNGDEVYAVKVKTVYIGLGLNHLKVGVNRVSGAR